jgi:hypothetical protein
VLEQEFARGHFHPFKERKGKKPQRHEQLKLKGIKTCERNAPGQHLSKVLKDRQSSEGSSRSRSGSERGLILNSRKLKRRNVLRTQAGAKVTDFAEEAKVKAFDT